MIRLSECLAMPYRALNRGGILQFSLKRRIRPRRVDLQRDGLNPAPFLCPLVGERVIRTCCLHKTRKEFVFAHLAAMNKRQIHPRKAVPETCRLIHRHSAHILRLCSRNLRLQILMRRGCVTQQMLCPEEILKTSLIDILKRSLGIALHDLLAHRTDSLLLSWLLRHTGSKHHRHIYKKEDFLLSRKGTIKMNLFHNLTHSV